MLKKLEQAKANNETLKVSYTTVLFTGSSGVGKTTLLNKLNKQQLRRHHHSTGIVESKHTICVKTTAVIKSTEGLQWIDLDYDSMISHLNKHLGNLKFPSLSSSAATSPPEESVSDDLDEKIDNAQSETPSLHLSPTSSLTDNIPRNESAVETNEVVDVDITKADEVTVDIAKADSSNAPSLGEVWDIINFLDTGGQPEFVNILPAVSSSIALTFIVFNLSESLGSLVHVKHNVRGESSFEPYDLDCTNLEFIKRLMVSSENFNKNITPSLQSIQREDGENDSRICYVGTHALNVSSEKVQEIDSQLSSIANELQLHQRSFWSSSKESLKRLFPVDMFPVDKDQASFEDIIEDIRDNIQKQVQKRDYYEVPITWFIFLLKLQKLCNVKNIGYISYQEAVDVWMDENVSKNELGTKSDQGLYKDQYESVSQENSDVHNILLFFHFMGMLFYYHKVEGMCDYVFLNRQWLFEKLTELVEMKFTKSYRKKDICAEDVEKFTVEGKLSINIIKNLKIDLQGIQPLHFINLLNRLNIIAPFDFKQKDYFMPCVLPSFPLTKSAEKLNELDMFYGNIQHIPLLVGFRNGPMPHGFFCHLIVELFRHLPKGWHLPLLSTSRMQHVYNNLITFPTTSGHAVSLFYKIGYLEVQVRHEESQPTIIHCNVQCQLDKALRKVSDHLQLNKGQLCYGFYCKCEGIQHFVKLEELTSPTEYIYCDYGKTKLTGDHRVWLQV